MDKPETPGIDYAVISLTGLSELSSNAWVGALEYRDVLECAWRMTIGPHGDSILKHKAIGSLSPIYRQWGRGPTLEIF